MRINWQQAKNAKALLGHLVDLTGAVEYVVCLMDMDLAQADGAPGIRMCWWDKGTDRFIDHYSGQAYHSADVRGWALSWADVRTLAPAVDAEGSVTPIVDCSHKGEDGCCQHERNLTPECHIVACPRLHASIYWVSDSAAELATLLRAIRRVLDKFSPYAEGDRQTGEGKALRELNEQYSLFVKGVPPTKSGD